MSKEEQKRCGRAHGSSWCQGVSTDLLCTRRQSDHLSARSTESASAPSFSTNHHPARSSSTSSCSMSGRLPGVQHPPTWQTPLPVWSPHPVPPFRRPGLSPPSASVQMLLQCYRSRRCERARRREPLCHPPPSIRQFNADWTLTANRTNPIHHPICAQPAVPLPTAADGHDATRRRRIADPHSPPC